MKDYTKKLTAIAAVGVVLAGCAGRSPNPVSTTSMSDQARTCESLDAEYNANKARLSELDGEGNLKAVQNVAAGVLGLFTLGIGWAAMDFQNAAGVDRDALNARQRYLASLIHERCEGR